MLKYLTRAMGALASKSPYEREIESRRAFFKQQQQRIKANRERVRAALERGDRHEALRLAQPGLRQDQTDSERRLASVYAEDDLLFAKVEREHANTRAAVAALRAQQDADSERRVIFADSADEVRYVKLFQANQYGAASEFLRERIACGMAVEHS